MMKRIFGLFLTAALLLGSVTAFADEIDNFWDAFSKQSYAGEVSFSIGAGFNKPLSSDLDAMFGIIDGMNLAVDMKYNIDPSYKKIEMYLDMAYNAPKDPAQTTKMQYWYKIDTTDKNVPKIYTVMKQDTEEKYMYLNQDKPAITAAGDTDLDKSKFDELNNKLTELHKKYMKPSFDNGVYQVTLDEASLKAIMKETMFAMYDYMYPQFAADQAIDMKAEYEKQVSDFFDRLDKAKVFADNAVVMTMTIDDQNQPKTLGYDINISTNLFDLVTAFDSPAEAMGLTKDNSDLDMTIKLNYNYTKFNQPVTISYPELTADNSVDLMAGMPQPDLDVNAVNVVLLNNNEVVALNHKPYIKDGITYLPLRETLNVIGVDDKDIVWTPEDQGITVNYGMEYRLWIGEESITAGEEKSELSAPVVLNVDTTYIPADILMHLGAGMKTRDFYGEDNSVIGSVVLLFDMAIAEAIAEPIAEPIPAIEVDAGLNKIALNLQSIILK